MTEVQSKINQIRAILKSQGLRAAHLRGVDWFSWITGGASSVVILTNEVGVAEILISENEAWVITNRIEYNRMVSEELSSQALESFQVTDFAWQDADVMKRFLNEKIGANLSQVVSDRPILGESALPAEFLRVKMVLGPQDIERYRKVGRLAAEAMTEAMAELKPDWSEQRLAGRGAQALWSRGLEPTLVLVSGHDRGLVYRHPLAKDRTVGESAMMVFCARGFGLFANLTRFAYFRDLTNQERAKFAALEKIESAALQSSRAGTRLSQVYQTLLDSYHQQGQAVQIDHHHQGGITGYLSREKVASPSLKGEDDIEIQTGMAFAWNPSLPGAKVEDTVLLGHNGLEVLTVDPQWPGAASSGTKQSNVWVRA
jgi:Xaa-Pro aminopeptidase